MKVIILGAKGNLGSRLVEVFKEEYDVVAWDREEIDITNKELVFKKINDEKPDIIINAVAYNAVDKCEEKNEFEKAKILNGDVVRYLADAALEVGAMLVHYSSDYVFDGEKISGYKEDDEPNPINNYAQTKWMGEKEIISKSGSGLKWYLIRTSKLFGPIGKSSIAKPSFFDIILKKSEEQGSLDIVNEEVSCFTYTVDLAKATKDLIENKGKYGIYHITNSGASTWFEAARELFKIDNTIIDLNPVTGDKFSRPAKRPKYSVLLNNKLKPLRDWREALRDYLKIERLED